MSEYPDNQNSHHKAFKIAPPDRDVTQDILDARKAVVRDVEMHVGPRLMFVHLLDLSAQRTTNKGLGIVTVSQEQLSEALGVSRRTIRQWKKPLVYRGYVWITPQFMPNMWPTDTYHITALDSRDLSEHKTSPEGLWGNGSRRSAPPSGAIPLPPGGSAPESAKKAAKCPLSGNKLPPSAANYSRPQGNPTSSQSGNLKTLGKEARSRPQRNGLSAVEGTVNPLGKEAGFPLNTAKVGSDQLIERGEEPPPALAGWVKRLEKMFPRELEAVRSKLVQDFQRTEPGDPQREDLASRMAWVDRVHKGGITPKRKAPVQPAKPIAPVARRSATTEELLGGARYLISIGKGSDMTAAQKAAWEAHEQAEGKSAPKS